ncbi:MAG: GNAT family N-acetyltransferase [Clostridiales bacterium]|nr:GNAT family N-acetyltransferase [Clostridiales bacterium]
MNLVIYSHKYQALLEAFFLEDDSFSKHPKVVLEEGFSPETFHPVLGFVQGLLVAFFVLDEGADKFLYTDKKNSLLLRSFSTDSRYTRRGFARSALERIPGFVKSTYPSIDTLVLGVNEENLPAIGLYQSFGFMDTGRTYLGKKGWQRIFELPLFAG